MTRSATSLAWLEWGDACARAREQDRPILLVLGTRWSHSSPVLQDALQDAAVVSALTGAAFLPARADADRRPDLADRYGFGEWPSVACLTPSGVLIAGAAATASPLSDLLRHVADAWRTRRDDIEHAAHHATEPFEPLEPLETLEPLNACVRTRSAFFSRTTRMRPARRSIDSRRTPSIQRKAAGGTSRAYADILDLFTHAGVLSRSDGISITPTGSRDSSAPRSSIPYRRVRRQPRRRSHWTPTRRSTSTPTRKW